MKKVLKYVPIGILTAVLIVYYVLLLVGRVSFETVTYEVPTEKVTVPVKIAVLADLHNWTFGKDNTKLIEEIRLQEPDIIIIAGDLINSDNRDASDAIELCRKLTTAAPVYYSYGNHENIYVYGQDIDRAYLDYYKLLYQNDPYGTMNYDRFKPVHDDLPLALEEMGIRLINNNAERIEVKGQTIDIAGIDNMPGSYFPYSSSMVRSFLNDEPENFKLIVAHRPTLVLGGISQQEDAWYDLAVSGHRHGGIIRIPGLGGMFSAGGFFPWFTGYDAGMYETDKGTLFVSRGLGNNNILPRINNKPELAMISLIPE